jgi:hypothetical protein
LDESVFMGVSLVVLINPYCHNKARAVPVVQTRQKGAFGRGFS